jgi:hypothetical protein
LLQGDGALHALVAAFLVFEILPLILLLILLHILLQGDGALHALVAAFLVFETAVGLYFPSIGTLRSKYVPVISILSVFQCDICFSFFLFIHFVHPPPPICPGDFD